MFPVQSQGLKCVIPSPVRSTGQEGIRYARYLLGECLREYQSGCQRRLWEPSHHSAGGALWRREGRKEVWVHTELKVLANLMESPRANLSSICRNETALVMPSAQSLAESSLREAKPQSRWHEGLGTQHLGLSINYGPCGTVGVSRPPQVWKLRCSRSPGLSRSREEGRGIRAGKGGQRPIWPRSAQGPAHLSNEGGDYF